MPEQAFEDYLRSLRFALESYDLNDCFNADEFRIFGTEDFS